MAGALELARAAFARRAWGDACARLRSLDPPLAPEDMERLAVAAYLTGHVADSDRAWEHAHLAFGQRGRHADAARCASWLAIGLMLRGEEAPANGWFGRAARLVEAAADECPAGGYVLLPAFLGSLEEGDGATAAVLSSEMLGLASRLDDPDLLALGTLCRGEAMLALGEIAQGLSLLDEAMVAVATDEVSPIPAGIVYCAVIEACVDAFDVRRAAQWTAALDRWCATQPDLVPYRGQCLVHRSQVLQAHGQWIEATAAARRATDHLREPAHPALGVALYQLGELQRLCGNETEAEESYRAAALHGRDPYPGLALLRLAQGRTEAAVAAIRRMIDERRGHLGNPALLAAAVEILLAEDDTATARATLDDLAKAADAGGAPLLHAMADFATGAILVAEGDHASALLALRRARDGWSSLEMPYEASRAAVLIARACQALGDADGAEIEAETARATFERLGATPELERARGHEQARDGPDQRPLTDRECEVLRLVATGRSNREIAAILVISEHTVGRHLQNIFGKLGLPSRTAAAAYAYEHHLV